MRLDTESVCYVLIIGSVTGLLLGGLLIQLGC